jgi:RecA-family ATPase
MPGEEAKLYYTGDDLKRAIFETPEQRKCLVESLIAEHSVTMFYAPDGTGKSLLMLQLAIQASSGEPVYGGFEVERPLSVIYVMAERHRNEIFERLRIMSGFARISYENLAITDALQNFDIADGKQREVVGSTILNIAKQFKQVDLICIDPIYALLPQGLKDEPGAAAVSALNRRLQTQLGCAICIVHHSTKGYMDQESESRRGRDMYGHNFLSAGLSGKFLIKAQGKAGTIFENQKDTFGCLVDGFKLTFDQESYLSVVEEKFLAKTKKELGIIFFKSRFNSGKEFLLSELMSASTCSAARAREQVSEQVKIGNAIRLSPNGQKGLYKMVKSP